MNPCTPSLGCCNPEPLPPWLQQIFGRVRGRQNRQFRVEAFGARLTPLQFDDGLPVKDGP